MGKFSADAEVDAAVTASENAFIEARDTLNPNSETSVATYKAARDAFFTARNTSRAGRGMSLTTE